MSETDRMAFYNTSRVLIETDRILDPPGRASTLHLEASHLEMPRNLTQYLHRQSTFVAEYQALHYLMPDDDDWDDILAIVAELEYRLMPNKVVSWGYTDRLAVDLGDIKEGDGTYTAWTDPVPKGEVWQIEKMTAHNNTTTAAWVAHYLFDGSAIAVISFTLAPYIGAPNVADGPITLKEGDKAGFEMGGCLNGDNIAGFVWGYKMAVD